MGKFDVAVPQTRPQVRPRAGWFLAMTPLVILIGVIGGCAVLVFSGALDECDHRPPGSLVSDLPEVAEIAENESTGRDCGRYADIRARGADIEEVEAALIEHFEAEGWALTEYAYGWDGTKVDGSHTYSLSMTAEFADGHLLEPEQRVGAARTIQITIDPWGGSVPTDPAGEEVTGPYLGSPRFVAGNVLVSTGDRVTAYSASTGNEIWQSGICPSADWASPFEGPDTDVAVLRCSGYQYGLDGSSGTFLWWAKPVDGFIDRTREGPDVIVYMSEEKGHVEVLDKATGEQRWSAPTADASLAANHSGVFVASDHAIIGYDAMTGDQLWSAPFPSSGLYADARGVFARGNDQRMRRLNPATGDVVWETSRVDERIEWSEVMGTTDRTVVVQRTQGAHEVTVFDIDDGSILWTIDGQMEGEEESQLWVSARSRWIVITDLEARTIRAFSDANGELVADLGRPGAQWASIHGDQAAFVYLDGTVRQLGIEDLE